MASIHKTKNIRSYEKPFVLSLTTKISNTQVITITTDIKSAGNNRLNYPSFIHFQSFSILDKSTGPILPFMALALVRVSNSFIQFNERSIYEIPYDKNDQLGDMKTPTLTV